MIFENTVKIVIWDLDETFWKGTLSEGKVQKNVKNLDILKCLVDRGIMCSIVSKNDFNAAYDVLREWGIADLFIFPQISWNPKGEQVKKVLNYCSLRPQNALFIDDNYINLREVEFYNPGIMTLNAIELSESLLDSPQLVGKADKCHTRLKQYKILEQKHVDEEKYTSNIEFLRTSGIKISISENFENKLDRIHELVERSNQLNYTKIRDNIDALNELISNKEVNCGYISVADNYGDYGVTGFYAIKTGEAIHFVFSCRTIGLGIENYVWKYLGYPKVSINGEVVTELDKSYAESIDWISVVDKGADKSEIQEKDNLLMIGGCDLEQACTYLEHSYSIDKEFNTVVNGNEIRTSDIFQLVNSLELDMEEKRELCDKIPFFDEGITFSTKVFSKNYKTVIISVVDDYIRGIWKHKKKGYLVGFGGYYDQDLFLSKYNANELEYLYQNFKFIGREPANVFKENLNKLLDYIGKDTEILLINGIDIDVSDWIGQDRVNRNKEMNAIVDEIVDNRDNVKLVDMRKIITSKDELIKHDNRHFKRISYYKMAEQIAQSVPCTLKTKNYMILETRFFLYRVIRKIYSYLVAKISHGK